MLPIMLHKQNKFVIHSNTNLLKNAIQKDNFIFEVFYNAFNFD